MLEKFYGDISDNFWVEKKLKKWPSQQILVKFRIEIQFFTYSSNIINNYRVSNYTVASRMKKKKNAWS